ncbi:hypothetical protein LTR94_033475, partial [Friedmanniomyces endolithicus]
RAGPKLPVRAIPAIRRALALRNGAGILGRAERGNAVERGGRGCLARPARSPPEPGCAAIGPVVRRLRRLHDPAARHAPARRRERPAL